MPRDNEKSNLVAETPPLVRETDISGDVAQFLLSVRPDDLVTELVQNELDAGSNRTVIEFRKEAVVCEGNGRPVDDAGWKRLRKVKSVGAQLEKRDGIGTKNHGLRVGFHLGNEIVVQSNGRETRLLVCGEGSGKGFDPAAWGYPVPKAEAPSTGCRVIVPYRTDDLPVPGREGLDLVAWGSEEIGDLFENAVSNAPRRFIGAICPGVFSRYELEIKHWREGEVRFQYAVIPLPGKRGRTLFRRLCRRTGPDGKSEVVVREEAHTFRIELEGLQRRHVPKFYRGKRTIVDELSWEIDSNGAPKIRPGKLRYPLEYPDGEPHSYSELGINFSAPFVSDAPRHGTAEGTDKNIRLTRLCEDRVPWVLRHRLVPRVGPRALELLRNPDRAAGDATERIVLMAATAGAFPAADETRGRRRKHQKGTRRRTYRCVPLASRSVIACSFSIPCYSWERDRIDPVLSQVCPPSIPQLHPGTPGFVVKFLTDKVCLLTDDSEVRSSNQDIPIPYSVFDENDALGRLQSYNEGHYPWEKIDDWERELGDPKRVLLYLDVVTKCLRSDCLKGEVANDLREHGMLPNDQRVPTKWSNLLWSRCPVPEIPGVKQEVLHPQLAGNKIFRRGPLKLEKFDLDKALIGIDWEEVENSVRRKFFSWLRRTPLKLMAETRREIAAYPIWLASENLSVRLDAFCEPKNKKITAILSGHILRAPKSVLRIKGVSKGGGGPFALRTVPTEREIEAWYQHRAPPLTARALNARRRAELDGLERELVILRQDQAVRPFTNWLVDHHMAIDENGLLRRVGELHVPIEHVKACGLLAKDITGGRHHRLYQALGARTRPSSDALKRALKEDASNQKLLHRRIDAYVRVSEDPTTLAEIPFIRLRKRGRLYAPCELVLPGKPDYWGKWKVRCNLPALNPDREENLTAIGVTDVTPDQDSSLEFFKWLCEQEEDTVRDHLVQVIRHFRHSNGPLAWWNQHRWARCLPVRSQGDQVCLVDHCDAVDANSKVYLPDFPEVEEQMLRLDRWRSVAIVNLPKMPGSILSDLKEAGVHSLRSECGHPVQVSGSGNESRAREHEEMVKGLTSQPLRHELPKRLEEQDIPSRNLKRNWISLLKGVAQVRVAEKVVATFKLGHYKYDLAPPWVFDTENSTIWITDVSDQQMLVYEAVSELIFKEGPPSHFAYPLRKAVLMDFRPRVQIDKGKRQGRQEDNTDHQIPETTEDKKLTATDKNKHAENNGRRRVHGAKDEFPIPSPIRMRRRRQSEYEFDALLERTGTRQRKRSASSRKTSPREEEEKQILKERHYAWHCQACLGSHQVSKVAPPPSYGYHVRHRKEIMEAHHVYHVGKGGPWGAGNLLVLCKYHHNLLGDRMSQNDIRAKLRDEAENTIRMFPVGKDAQRSKKISGKLIRLDLDVEPYSVELFFTKAHAEVWQTER